MSPDTYTCCQCGASFEIEPKPIAGCRAPDEMGCLACFEEDDADVYEALVQDEVAALVFERLMGHAD